MITRTDNYATKEKGKINSWFSHDVTKIQSKKLSLLLSVYFHVTLEHLKTFIQTNFWFKRVLVLRYRTLEFPGFFVTRLAAGKALKWVKNITDFCRFCYLNIPRLRINIALIFMSS